MIDKLVRVPLVKSTNVVGVVPDGGQNCETTIRRNG
jgi:hypothetical protein